MKPYIIACTATLIIASFLTGCAPTSTKLSEDTELIHCGGAFNSLDQCVIKAKEVCPNKYDVLSVSEPKGIQSIHNSDGSYSTTNSNLSRSMLIKCK